MSHPCDSCGRTLGFHEIGLICSNCKSHLLAEVLDLLKAVRGDLTDARVEALIIRLEGAV